MRADRVTTWFHAVQAMVMAGVLAAVIFTAWHLVLHYVAGSPYDLPHPPYVSVSNASYPPVFESMGENMGRYLIQFWRFGG